MSLGGSDRSTGVRRDEQLELRDSERVAQSDQEFRRQSRRAAPDSVGGQQMRHGPSKDSQEGEIASIRRGERIPLSRPVRENRRIGNLCLAHTRELDWKKSLPC